MRYRAGFGQPRTLATKAMRENSFSGMGVEFPSAWICNPLFSPASFDPFISWKLDVLIVEVRFFGLTMPVCLATCRSDNMGHILGTALNDLHFFSAGIFHQ